jgi:hypothetical protein
LPKSALSGQSGGPVSTDAAYATWPTYTTHAADTSHATYTSYAAYATRPAHATYAADTSYATYATRPAHATYATGPTYTTYTAGDRVAIEAVVVVDINIATTPAATPAPTAAPPRSHQHSRTEGERGACGVVAGWIVERRIWIRRRTVYSCRLI